MHHSLVLIVIMIETYLLMLLIMLSILQKLWFGIILLLLQTLTLLVWWQGLGKQLPTFTARFPASPREEPGVADQSEVRTQQLPPS